MMKKMCLEAKRLNLKEGSIPTLYPSRTLMLGQKLGGRVPFTSVQCDLIGCGPLDQPFHSTPDVSDDDLDIEDSDTGSVDHSGCNNLEDTFQSIMYANVIEEASEDAMMGTVMIYKAYIE